MIQQLPDTATTFEIWDKVATNRIGNLLPGEFEGSAFSLFGLDSPTISLSYIHGEIVALGAFTQLLLGMLCLLCSVQVLWGLRDRHQAGLAKYRHLASSALVFSCVCVGLALYISAPRLTLFELAGDQPATTHKNLWGCVGNIPGGDKPAHMCTGATQADVFDGTSAEVQAKATSLSMRVHAKLVEGRCLISPRSGSALRCLEHSAAPYKTIWDVVAAVEPTLPSCIPMGSTESFVNSGLVADERVEQQLQAEFKVPAGTEFGARVSLYSQFVCVSPTGGLIENVPADGLAKWLVGKLNTPNLAGQPAPLQ